MMAKHFIQVYVYKHCCHCQDASSSLGAEASVQHELHFFQNDKECVEGMAESPLLDANRKSVVLVLPDTWP